MLNASFETSAMWARISEPEGSANFQPALTTTALREQAMAKPADTTIPTPKKCSVEGCTRGGRTIKGMCGAHYVRCRRNGDPTRGRCDNGAPLRWLLERVTYEGDDCIRWPYAHNQWGYPAGIAYNGKRTAASRVMCELANGPPPSPEYEGAHSCGNGNKGCLNRKHLRWATSAENNADKIGHGTLIRGGMHVCSKLSEQAVRQIKNDTRSQSAIARDYGVTQSVISRIKRGRVWRHVG